MLILVYAFLAHECMQTNKIDYQELELGRKNIQGSFCGGKVPEHMGHHLPNKFCLPCHSSFRMYVLFKKKKKFSNVC